MTEPQTKRNPKQLNKPELEQVYGGAGEIKSNYLTIKAQDTKTDPPERL